MASKNPKNSENRFAVITGASSGIGYELAKVFAKNGFDLLIAAEDDGISAASAALNELGTSVEYMQVDLAKRTGVEDFFAQIQSTGRRIDALVLNAGVGVGGPFLENDLEAELNLIRLNIVSPVHLAKRVLPLMVAAGEGKVLITSSVAGESPGPYYAVYAASKAFVQSFSEAIRIELKEAETGVTVTALQPGATETNFFARAGMLDTKAGEAKKDDPAVVAQQGFDAMMNGDDHVVAGSVMNKIQTGITKVLPQTQTAKMQGEQVKPNSLK